MYDYTSDQPTAFGNENLLAVIDSIYIGDKCLQPVDKLDTAVISRCYLSFPSQLFKMCFPTVSGTMSEL